MVGTSGMVSTRLPMVTPSALTRARSRTSRCHRPDVAEHHRDVTGDHVVERRPAAPIGNVLDVGAGHALEQLHIDVMRRAHAARARSSARRACDFASATISATELTGTDGLTTSTNGTAAISEISEKSVTGS